MPNTESNEITQLRLKLVAGAAIEKVLRDMDEVKIFATQVALNLSLAVVPEGTDWRFTAIKTRLESATIAAKEAIEAYTEYRENSTVPEEKHSDF
jgi:hypothetical protein